MVTSFIGVECHFQQYVSYSVEHGDQFYWCLTPLSTILVIAYNMVTSFIGVECHFQQYVSYSVEHGDQFYWCLMPLSTMLVIA